MPKIIEGLRDKILSETRWQLRESGYCGTTIRSVAKACGISPGTIYNYFDSKETLVATFVIEDWMKVVDSMKEECSRAQTDIKVVEIIFSGLKSFGLKYNDLFRDDNVVKSVSTEFRARHRMLRTQIAELIADSEAYAKEHDDVRLAEFIAEALIVWSLEDVDFADIEKYIYGLMK